MSNILAVATVTATLARVLQDPANEAVSGASVTTGRPEAPDEGTSDPGINLYLYRVEPNTAFRNDDLVTRRTDGTAVRRPQVALNLHYLLSFYGNESELHPERLLGSAVSALHAEPILSSERIQAAIDAELASDPAHFLGDSDLARQVESVRITPVDLNLEELSKLWSVFFQTPYVLSAAYQASVVLVEHEIAPVSALPVRARNVYVNVFGGPSIASVRNADDATSTILTGSEVEILGEGLRGDTTTVRIGAWEITPDDADVTNGRILFTMPADVQAGARSLRVSHGVMMGTPETAHAGFESNAEAILVRPTVSAVSSASATEVTVTFSPPVGRGQRTRLLLNEYGAPSDRDPCAYVFGAPGDNGITDPAADESDEITFAVSDVEAATYLVRVQVDGAESLLDTDSDGVFNDPTVAIP